MRKFLVLLVIAVLFLYCGGKSGETTDTAQGAAKLWLQAALSGDEARMRELTVDGSETKLLQIAKIIRQEGFSKEEIRWAAAGTPGGDDYSWTAAQGTLKVTIELTKVGEGKFEVREVSTSW